MPKPKWIKGKKAIKIWLSLDEKKEKTTKQLSKESSASLSYTYKTIKKFKKHGEAFTIQRKPFKHRAVR